MSRSLSPVAKRALFAQQTGEVIQALVTITHASIVGGPLRFVSDMQNCVSNGDTYTAFPFKLVLPDDDAETPPRLKLTIDNVDRQIVEAIRSIPPSTPPTVHVEFVFASQPDVVEASFSGFTLREVQYDALTIEGDLIQEEISLEPFPEGAFTPNYFAGLF